MPTFLWSRATAHFTCLLQDLKDGLNYGLYCPPTNGKAGKFLDEERLLQDYPLPGPIGYLEVCSLLTQGLPPTRAYRFFFFRVLHTISSHLRVRAFAHSVTVARSSAVQASSSRRQERRWAIVCGSPQSQSTDLASSR